MRWPNISQVASDLREINSTVLEFEDSGEGIDVRLQVYEDGAWAVHFGDGSYDTDHRGYWGASSVPGNSERFSATAVAKELIDQAKDDYASSRW
jgi:hypothetical protein